jgi:hypothetical protein
VAGWVGSGGEANDSPPLPLQACSSSIGCRVLLPGVEVGKRRRFHTVQKTNDFLGEYTFYTISSKKYRTVHFMA